MVTIYRLFIFLLKRFYEILYINFLKFLYPKEKKLNNYNHYVFYKKNLKIKERKNGISGFYRVKNEEKLLSTSIDSHLSCLDEIIIVYNNCNDKTPEIAHKYEKKYPDKIKVYKYIPNVYPALSKKHVITSPNSPHSLINYYNFTLSKTTRKIAVKIDADHIATSQFKDVANKIRNTKLNKVFYFYGVNIYKKIIFFL